LGIFICGAVGLLALATAYFFWLRVNKFISASLPSEGEIIGFEEHHGDGTTYSPIVRFKTRDGQEIEFTDSVYANPPGYSVGERIKIFYHRGDFRDARIAKPTRLYFLPGFFLLLSIAFLGVSLLIVAIELLL
jgi:hypothetical protein